MSNVAFTSTHALREIVAHHIKTFPLVPVTIITSSDRVLEGLVLDNSDVLTLNVPSSNLVVWPENVTGPDTLEVTIAWSEIIIVSVPHAGAHPIDLEKEQLRKAVSNLENALKQEQDARAKSQADLLTARKEISKLKETERIPLAGNAFNKQQAEIQKALSLDGVAARLDERMKFKNMLETQCITQNRKTGTGRGVISALQEIKNTVDTMLIPTTKDLYETQVGS